MCPHWLSWISRVPVACKITWNCLDIVVFNVGVLCHIRILLDVFPFLTSVKPQNDYVDEKISPEPPSTQGWVAHFGWTVSLKWILIMKFGNPTCCLPIYASPAAYSISFTLIKMNSRCRTAAAAAAAVQQDTCLHRLCLSRNVTFAFGRTHTCQIWSSWTGFSLSGPGRLRPRLGFTGGVPLWN